MTVITPKRGDRVFTPLWVAQDMVRHFNPSGLVLEPFKGNGVFTSLLPNAEWCEIDNGRDFFTRSARADWIITNPPYSKTRICFRHAMRLADDIVFLVPLRNVFSGNGFVTEIFQWGGIVEIRVYGTGCRLVFPMGNCVGAMHFRREWGGPTAWSFFPEAAEHTLPRRDVRRRTGRSRARADTGAPLMPDERKDTWS